MVAKVTWPFFTILTYYISEICCLKHSFSVAAYFHYNKRRLIC